MPACATSACAMSLLSDVPQNKVCSAAQLGKSASSTIGFRHSPASVSKLGTAVVSQARIAISDAARARWNARRSLSTSLSGRARCARCRVTRVCSRSCSIILRRCAMMRVRSAIASSLASFGSRGGLCGISASVTCPRRCPGQGGWWGTSSSLSFSIFCGGGHKKIWEEQRDWLGALSTCV